MKTDVFPISLKAAKNNIFQVQKRFAYYRFHKRVGKGSWSRYIERYQLPRSIENTQRLIFNYEATFSEKKISSSWQWMLPKKLAQATTSDEVLNVWVYYRHKRKKAYHYMKVLKRLVDVGMCSSSDWRFKLISSRIENKINTFLNLPRICYYYGKLKATAQLENMTKMLNNRLYIYLPYQLILILRGFSICKLQDKYLFNKIRDLLRPHIKTITFSQLTQIIECYASCLIHDYLFFNELTQEIAYRISLCNSENHNQFESFDIPHFDNKNDKNYESNNNEENEQLIISENDDYIDSDRDKALLHALASENSLLKYKQEHLNYYPNIKNLIDIAYYFSVLKFQNYPFFDYISMYAIHMLKNEENCLNPHLIEKIVQSFYSLKINDVKLFEHILKHIQLYLYDYPPSVLCAIGYYLSLILPCQYSEIFKIFKKMLLHVESHINILDMDSLTKLSSFVSKTFTDKESAKRILLNINEQVKKIDRDFNAQGDSSVEFKRNKSDIYDVPKLIEVLSLHNCIDEGAFNILCKHAHNNIKYFEPCDFNRISRAFNNIKKNLNLCDEKIINAISRHVIKQHDLFNVIDYHQTVNSLLQIGTMKDIYKIYLVKHHNNIPFYGFNELTINFEIPNESQKPIYRYKNGTIFFSNKKIKQQYPLYKSIDD
ncbi:conserved Plasmodium protein, unknown function [Plasmodium vinckei lentum]|uniref:Uncharacterized protein n=1 Tax=Plasmodium vinckei lentum TaxID=138297 RepID=A0A6V7S634_PLAVN|nr:conserved Plasmodium protein, unknown function [Plasmodium vinckei lentum]